MLSVLRRVGTHREEDHVSLQDKEPRKDSSHQKLGGRVEWILLQSSKKESRMTDTLISDFSFPEL